MPDASFATTVNETVDNSTFSIQFNDLEEFVIYRFTISARTQIGFGPRSPEESARTDEAGNHENNTSTCNSQYTYNVDCCYMLDTDWCIIEQN